MSENNPISDHQQFPSDPKDKSTKPSRKPVVRIILVVFLICIGLFLAFWLFDAPPIEKDYTINDLYSAGPEYAGSYELLLAMGDNDPNSDSALPIGLTAADVNTLNIFVSCGSLAGCKKDVNHIEIQQKIAQNSDKIDRLWQNAEKGRLLIQKLNTYEEIADLSEPNINSEYVYFSNLGRIIQIYNLRTVLEFQRDNQITAVETLSEIYSIGNKLSITARPIVTKLICFGIATRCIETANLLSNQQQCSIETINTLSNIFAPLDPQVVSMRNCLIHEYLLFRNTILYDATMAKARNTPFYKANSALRIYRNFISDALITYDEETKQEKVNLSVWPAHLSYLNTPRLTQDVNLPKIYFIYNPMGSMLLSILTPAMEQVMHTKTKVQIRDDLLQIVLNSRLGKPYSLKARAYSDEYIIDVDKRIIFSPGPDGQSYTDDDIKLEINPEVLGLTKQ